FRPPLSVRMAHATPRNSGETPAIAASIPSPPFGIILVYQEWRHTVSAKQQPLAPYPAETQGEPPLSPQRAFVVQFREGSAPWADGQCLATSGGTDLSDLSQVYEHLRRPINIFAKNGKDPREPQPQTDKWKKYGPIGIVRTNGEIPNLDTGASIKGGRSTAFLVSPCHVLTNYHSVFGSAE